MFYTIHHSYSDDVYIQHRVVICTRRGIGGTHKNMLVQNPELARNLPKIMKNHENSPGTA